MLLIKTGDVATLLGKSPASVRGMVARGEIKPKYTTEGGHNFFNKEEIQKQFGLDTPTEEVVTKKLTEEEEDLAYRKAWAKTVQENKKASKKVSTEASEVVVDLNGMEIMDNIFSQNEDS